MESTYLCTFRIRCQPRGQRYLHRQTYWSSLVGVEWKSDATNGKKSLWAIDENWCFTLHASRAGVYLSFGSCARLSVVLNRFVVTMTMTRIPRLNIWRVMSMFSNCGLLFPSLKTLFLCNCTLGHGWHVENLKNWLSYTHLGLLAMWGTARGERKMMIHYVSPDWRLKQASLAVWLDWLDSTLAYVIWIILVSPSNLAGGILALHRV
jgi:hypothetical protein